jgi:hypothetical protein
VLPVRAFEQLHRHFQICGRKSFDKSLIDFEDDLSSRAGSSMPCRQAR